jgi:hypothetical protein
MEAAIAPEEYIWEVTSEKSNHFDLKTLKS